MQTTLRIDDHLYRQAKAEAAREGITLTRFLEDALRSRLHNKQKPVPGKPHPFPVYIPEKPLRLSSGEIKRIAQEEEMRHDLKKLGVESEDA